jgi:F-type H+-transporting ATPase subunit delta
MSQSDKAGQSFDPDRQHVGTVYARALIGAAENQGLTDRVLAELNSLMDDVLDQLPQFAAALAYPRISFEDKQRMLDRAFADKMTPLLLNFLKVVARHERLGCLPEMRAAALRISSEIRGRVDVDIRTADPLSSDLRDQIAQRLTIAIGRPVDLNVRVDTELLGGMVVRVGDTEFDGSLDNQLRQLRKQALQRTTDTIRDSLERFLVTE